MSFHELVRDKNGKWTSTHKTVDAKFIVVILITAFIMFAIAQYAHEAHSATQNYEHENADARTNIVQPIEHPDANQRCVTTGQGTGRIESYCADTPENLIKTIRTKWNGGADENKEGDKPQESGDDIRQEAHQTPQALKMTSNGKYVRKGSSPQIEALIRAEAKKQGYTDDIELLLNVIDCESRFDPKATNNKNNNPPGSIDRGLAQFSSYWYSQVSDECAYEPSCAVKTMIQEFKKGHANRWVCYNIVTK